MKPQQFSTDNHNEHWEYSMNKVSLKSHLADKNTVKGSQFHLPLLEFSGACPGCGETPYVKLLTQLFGDRLVIANASGCSSVWGGTASTNPYTVNNKGQGPAWGRSLFEDNAEYGFGMAVATKQRREGLALQVQEAINVTGASQPLKAAFANWLQTKGNFDKCSSHVLQIERLLPSEKG